MDRPTAQLFSRFTKRTVTSPRKYKLISHGNAVRDDQYSSEHDFEEWTPLMLRTPCICVLVALLVTGIGAIELLNSQLEKRNGLSSDNNLAVLTLRYIPTTVAIGIAFIWRRMVADIALVTPWASMSNSWIPAENSILLNYLDGLDITTIRDSFRKKHWALCLGASCGIIVGALVPIANALPELRIQESFTHAAKFAKESTFGFGTSLLPPIDWRAQLTAQTIQLARVNYSAWSSIDMTYESLNLSSATARAVRSIDATVDAFSASLHCVSIDFNCTFNDYDHGSVIYLQALNPRPTCSMYVEQMVSLNFNSSNATLQGMAGAAGLVTVPLAWTNVTACEDTGDLDFVFTLMQLDFPSFINQSSSSPVQMEVAAFLCSPRYQMFSVDIRVDPRDQIPQSTEITTKNTTNIDLGLTNDVLYTLMQQPLLSYNSFQTLATSDFSTYGTLPNSLNWSEVRQLQIPQRFANISLYNDPNTGQHLRADYYMRTFVPFVDDPSATRLSDNNSLVTTLIRDPQLLQSALTSNFAITLSQQVNVFGRRSDSALVDATVNLVQDRYHLRQLSVRLLECSLAILSISSILMATVLRPRSVLVEPPNSLKMIAGLLAADQELEHIFEFENAISDTHVRRQLSGYDFALLRTTSGRVIMRARRDRRDNNHTCGIALEPTTGREQPAEVLTDGSQRESSGLWYLPIGRYRPFALRGLIRYGLPVVLLTTIAMNTAFLVSSVRRHGFVYKSKAIELCSAYGPTIFLVLTGYATQSMYVSSRKIEYFHLLNRGETAVADVLDRAFCSGGKTPTMLICTLLVLVLPLIKLVVSGLYIPMFTVRPFSDGIASINMSPIDHYFTIANNLTADNMRAYNLNHGEKNLIFKYTHPDLLGHSMEIANSYNVPLIKTNFSEQILSASKHVDINSSSITIRVPGFNTSVDCIQAKADIFDVRVYIFGDKTYNLTLTCEADSCEQYNDTLAAISFSYNSPVSAVPGVPQFLSAIESHIGTGSFVIIAADFSALATTAQPGWNVTSVSNGSVVTRSHLGELYPIISAARCETTMQRVSLNISKIVQDPDALYTQFGTDLDYGTWILDDQFSSDVEVEATYQAADLPALIFPWPHNAVFAKASTPDFQRSTTSVSTLVSQLQLNLTGDYLDIFKDENLAAATTRVLRDIAIRSTGALLGDLRAGSSLSVTNIAYPPPNDKQVRAVLNISRLVIEQSIVRTITLSVFLIIVSACVLYLALLIPMRTILPRAPSSIANQLSLLAGSKLIERLRQEQSTTDLRTLLRDLSIKLGWWYQPPEDDRVSGSAMQMSPTLPSPIVPSPYHEAGDELSLPDIGDGATGLRWGLDIRADVTSSLLTQHPSKFVVVREQSSSNQASVPDRYQTNFAADQRSWEMTSWPAVVRSRDQ